MAAISRCGRSTEQRSWTPYSRHRLYLRRTSRQCERTRRERTRRRPTFSDICASGGTTPGETVALEAIEPTTPKYKYSPFMLALTSDPKEVEVLAMKSDQDLVPKGCFIHQNEIKASVAAKQAHDEWLPVKRDQGLKATSIASRRAFYLDFDPVREDGISSTSGERRLALRASGPRNAAAC